MPNDEIIKIFVFISLRIRLMIYHLSFSSQIIMGISYTVSFVSVRWIYTLKITSLYNILYTHDTSMPKQLCDAKLNKKWFYWTILIFLDIFFTTLLTLLPKVMKNNKSARIDNQSLLVT